MTQAASTQPIETLARIQEASFARAGETSKRAFPPERSMDGATLLSFLQEVGSGVFSTVRPDGRPHAAPIRFAVAGTTFVMASSEDATRVRNLRARPHASLVVMRETPARAVVVVEGTARLLPAATAPLAMREPFRDGEGRLPSWVEVVIALTPERLLSYAG